MVQFALIAGIIYVNPGRINAIALLTASKIFQILLLLFVIQIQDINLIPVFEILIRQSERLDI
jgi:hypothetical protein